MYPNIASQLKTCISVFSSNANFTVTKIKLIYFILNIFFLLDYKWGMSLYKTSSGKMNFHSEKP